MAPLVAAVSMGLLGALSASRLFPCSRHPSCRHRGCRLVVAPQDLDVTDNTCYAVAAWTLDSTQFGKNFLPKCRAACDHTYALLVVSVVLCVTRLLAQLVWFTRCIAASDHGKKGPILIFYLLPFILSVAPFVEYRSACVLQFGTTSAQSAGHHPSMGNGMWIWCSLYGLYLLGMALEFVIPAGEYAMLQSKTSRAPPPSVVLHDFGHGKSAIIHATDKVEAAVASAAVSVKRRASGATATAAAAAAATSAAAAAEEEDEDDGYAEVAGSGAAHTWLTDHLMPGQHTNTASRGELRVHLQRAVGLKAGDSNGYSDPYARLTLCGVTKKSKTVPKTLNPQWNERFEFRGVLSALIAQPLLVRVTDWDFGPWSSKLGEASFPLDGLRSARQLDMVQTLSEGGTVHLHVSWAADGEKHQRPSKPWRPAPDGLSARSASALDLEGGVGTSARVVRTVSQSVLSSMAAWIADPFGSADELSAIDGDELPAELVAREYYVITRQGPRAGECSERTYTLGALYHMHRLGEIPRKLEVWAKADGQTWRDLGDELDLLEAQRRAHGGATARRAEEEERAVKIQKLARGRSARRDLAKQLS